MGIIEALDRLHEIGIHSGARRTLERIGSQVKRGELSELASDPRHISALSLLGELIRAHPQISTLENNPRAQLDRGLELFKLAEKIRPEHLATYRDSRYLKALDRASEHPHFTIAANAVGLADFLRIFETETQPKKPVPRVFPKDAANGFMALLKRGLDPSLPIGQGRLSQGIQAIRRALHTNVWQKFKSNPEFFSRAALFAPLMPPEDLRRVLMHRPRQRHSNPNQDELFKIWETFAGVLYHPNLRKYLEIHNITPGHEFVRRHAPSILEKLGNGEPLLADERHALYAWAIKAIEGGEGRDRLREGTLLGNYDSGRLDVEKLAALGARLDRMNTP